MDKKRLDEIRARELALPPGPWVSRQDIPDLLDHITEQEAEIVELAECAHLAIKDRRYFEAEAKRLREALRVMEGRSLSALQCNDPDVPDFCLVCGRFKDDGHADVCPFKVLET